MKSVAAFSKLDNFTLNRLLRRESIDRLVMVCKGLIVVGTVGFAVWNVRLAFQDTLQSKKAVQELENDVQTFLSKISTSQETQDNVRLDYDSIVKHNIFGNIGAKAKVEAAPTKKAPPVSKVALKLIGTFLTVGEDPYAIIENTKDKGAQEIFNIGNSIFEEAKLIGVYSDKVEIERAGQIEILQLDEISHSGGADEASDENTITVDEKELDDALSNLPLLLTQARAVPYFKDGKSIGLRLFAIRRGSLFEKIGLKNGDILKSINGNSLGDITQAVKLFEKLKEQRNIAVMLERQRQEQTFTYQIR